MASAVGERDGARRTFYSSSSNIFVILSPKPAPATSRSPAEEESYQDVGFPEEEEPPATTSSQAGNAIADDDIPFRKRTRPNSQTSLTGLKEAMDNLQRLSAATQFDERHEFDIFGESVGAQLQQLPLRVVIACQGRIQELQRSPAL